MIIKASQRGNARELARHLTNEKDNEQVEIHEITGFIDDTVLGAFEEAQAVSQGTKCTQFLFSVSLNPPKNEQVTTADFEEAVTRIEEKMKLEGHPRVVVFHEKENRRHAHAVWSRIDSESMTAVNLPFFKNKMNEIAKELYLKHGWELPQGFVDKEMRNPLNFTLEQCQQAKRLNESPQTIKNALKEIWTVSDNKTAFTQALEQKGFYLAQGDRRGFVAVDWRGEVYSLSRWIDVKTKALKARLGDPKDLLSVEETKANLDEKLAQQVQLLLNESDQKHQQSLSPLLAQKSQLIKRHKAERDALKEEQDNRRHQEAKEHQERLNKGIRALWDRFTGKYAEIQRQNEVETYETHLRNRAQTDTVIHRQLDERQPLQQQYEHLQTKQQEEKENIKERLFSGLPVEKINQVEQVFSTQTQTHSFSFDIEM